MNAWVGTSGFSYKEWKGAFYPEDLPDREMLTYYGGRLNTVEINSTFYRMPTAKLLTGWASQVPERFSFVLKASRRITHQKKLRDAAEEVEYLVATASELGTRLGPILFQLPPHVKRDASLLRDFLDLLPDGLRVAFEFRSSSWFDDEIHQALTDSNAALVVEDTHGEEPDPSIIRTAPYGYARLRREEYAPGQLEEWAEKLTDPDWDDLWVFFKHEEAGTGPKLASAFAELIGGSG